jgi:lysophospholipase L1-like esterase
MISSNFQSIKNQSEFNIPLKNIFLITGFLLLCCFSSNIKAQNESKPDLSKIVVMYGNSITFQGNWEQVLNRKDVLNWGIPGYLTGQLIWTIKDVLKKYPGTKIWFLEGGINDISLGVPVDRIYENQKLVIDSLKRNNIIPVVQSTILKNNAPCDNRKVNALNKKIQKYCVHHDIDYINLNALFSTKGELRKELTIDGTHLKKPCYISWAEKVTLILKKHNLSN